MAYDLNNQLWLNKSEHFFQDEYITPVLQDGPHCVSTSLAILTGAEPEDFQGVVNTQDPISWSQSLGLYGMKLAYCPTDARRLEFYMSELIELDDLFTLSYYTARDEYEILSDPGDRGWIGGSHVVVMHRDQIYDPARGNVSDALKHHANIYHTKRIFRVVPIDHQRGV